MQENNKTSNVDIRNTHSKSNKQFTERMLFSLIHFWLTERVDLVFN